MSEQEYKSRLNSLKPFITLFIVVMGTAFLASCGGGSSDTDQTIQENSVASDDPTKQALGVSGGTVPNGWIGRMPPKVTNSSISEAIPSPQGLIAARILLLEIAIGKDRSALSYIASKKWSIVARNEEILKVSIGSMTYESMSEAKVEAESSGNFSLVEFVGFTGTKAFSDPDPSLKDQSYWNYDAINSRQAWAALGSVTDIKVTTAAVFDTGFSLSTIGDLKVNNIYNSIGAICNDEPNRSASGCSHGYHVAGLISATGNDGVGHVGLANGYTNKSALRAAEVSADDGLMVSLRDELLTYSGDLKSFVVNMSLGNPVQSGTKSLNADEFSEIVEGARRSSRIIRSTVERRMKARAEAGLSNEVLFVQASGNEGRVKIPNDRYLPAEYSYLFASFLSYQTGSTHYQYVKDRTILVGSFDSERNIAESTSLPSTDSLASRFILAPGVSISSNTRVGIQSWSGTSMAAPHVAAVASMLKQVNGDLSAKDVADIILSTADNQAGSKWNEGDGYRYLNAEAAVKEAIRRKPLPNCSDGVSINRSNAVSMSDLNAWGSATCKDAYGRPITILASEQNLYLKAEDPNQTQQFGFRCIQNRSWNCGGYIPVFPFVFDANGNGAIDVGHDYNITSSYPSYGLLDAFAANGCSVWNTPYEVYVGSNSQSYIYGGLSARYGGSSASGFGPTSCASYNMSFAATDKFTYNHWVFAYAVPWSKLGVALPATFKLTPGSYTFAGYGTFEVKVK